MWQNSLCIFKTKASRRIKLYSYFYSLYNIWKDQFYRINSSEFYECFSGPKHFPNFRETGLSWGWDLVHCASENVIFWCTTSWHLISWCPLSQQKMKRKKGTLRLLISSSLSRDLMFNFFVGRAAYQRTVNLGKRFLLEWCCSEIPNSSIDPRGPFLDL